MCWMIILITLFTVRYDNVQNITETVYSNGTKLTVSGDTICIDNNILSGYEIKNIKITESSGEIKLTTYESYNKFGVYVNNIDIEIPNTDDNLNTINKLLK